MSNDKLKFWVKCPECQRPFGVFPRAVLQYLNRLVEAHGFEVPEPYQAKKGAEPREETGPKQEAQPQEPQGRETAPKRPYRRGSYPSSRYYGKREER